MYNDYLSSFEPTKEIDFKYKLGSGFEFESLELEKPKKKKEARFNWRTAAVKSLMQGQDKNNIIGKLTNSVVNNNLRQEITDFVNKYYGLAGVVFVDCGKIGNKAEYGKYPNKDYHCYVVNCGCFKEVDDIDSCVTFGGDIDGALMGDDVVNVNKVKVCQKTGLPFLEDFKRVDRGKLNQMLNKMARDGVLNERIVAEIKSSKNIMAAIRNVFHKKLESKTIKQESPIIDKEFLVYGLKNNSDIGELMSNVKTIELETVEEPKEVEVEVADANDYNIDTEFKVLDNVEFNVADNVADIDFTVNEATKLENCEVDGANSLFIVLKPLAASMDTKLEDKKSLDVEVTTKKAGNIKMAKKANKLNIDHKTNLDW